MLFSVCELCGRALQGGELCPSCLLKKQEIQRYADLHSKVGPAELSEKFDVSAKVLQSWVKRGMLNCSITCRQCGQPIRNGTLCPQCKTELAMGMKVGDPETKYVGRMHSRNRKG